MFVSILAATIILVALSLNSAIADSTIPQWIRSSSKYWSEGSISDGEYLQGIQYLILQGIIKIPVQQVVATNTPISDNDRVQSLVVHIKTGQEYTFNTFQKLIVFGQTITSSTNTPQSSFSAGQFQLESIPSSDKKPYYDLISQYINAGTKPNPFDINIDLITGDGKTLETLQYSKCEPTLYWAYTNTNKEEYRLGSIDAPEIRDITNFTCQGFRLSVSK